MDDIPEIDLLSSEIYAKMSELGLLSDIKVK